MAGRRATTKAGTGVGDDPSRSGTPAPTALDGATDEVGNDSGIDLSIEIVGIEELQNHGINVSDIQKLRSAGIHSISVSSWLYLFIGKFFF